ncbi:NAD(P)-dependent glycerol-3-phosphate dehydrogenase [Demequina sp. TTPB684]|uniref:NAD(P)H-dependent glycerol-3-phosphate dehydrogenase n=1 Tax=unclassified Demequina TaxID=2620311 RepID=UPI001CF25B98|nr:MULTISPECIES: NAD(P)H-dependent glycerol-3-phosphate dehydrogenase [unclassified Demequina]MCB2412013.1 NAD(P)-dependent glycerol-3-phosphate dehydrogenase [Demequina sp. TTPB684]UPU89695.1 NAD(P)-dependent glycerol-3-phosphate dehydrogenase [Demequina sp. TMPB413]
MRAAVLGAGAWGTTFAAVLADAGCDVVLWGRDATVARDITATGRNERFLPGIDLPQGVAATDDAEEALSGAELVAVALPSQHVRSIVAPFASYVSREAIVVSLMKGIERGTLERMSELLGEAWDVEPSRRAVVSGPNLAKEIAAKQPTATVIASASVATAETVARATASGYFRPYTNTDVLGVELSGAYKNIIAVAVGIADGMGFGHNTTATVMTRGLAEMTRLGLALDAKPDTFSGLAGMGDLIATCASPLSRNHTLGAHIGSGAELSAAITLTGGTAEGVTTSQSIQEFARSHGVDVPICDAVVAMLHDGQPKEAVLGALLARPRKAEGV